MEMVRRNTKPGKLKHWTRRRGRMGTREEARREITTRGNEGEESGKISEDERIDRREGVGRGSGVGGEITEYERIYGKEGVGRGSGEERENGEDVIAEVGEGRGIGRRDGKGESSEDERTKTPRRPNGVIHHYLVSLTRSRASTNHHQHHDNNNNNDDDDKRSQKRGNKGGARGSKERGGGQSASERGRVPSERQDSASLLLLLSPPPRLPAAPVGSLVPGIKRVSRGRRQTEPDFTNDEEFEAELSTSFLLPHPPPQASYVPLEDHHYLRRDRGKAGRPRKRVKGLEEEAEEEDEGVVDMGNEGEEERGVTDTEGERDGRVEGFPLHQGQTVFEFPSHAGIQAVYQLHEENLTKYNQPHPTISGVFLRQVHLTTDPRLTIHSGLLHYSLYSVSVSTCHAPITVPFSPHRRKLCSSFSARTSAYTRADGIEEGRGGLGECEGGDDQCQQQGGGSGGKDGDAMGRSHDPEWRCPRLCCQDIGVSMERCVGGESEEGGGRLSLPALPPGSYTDRVKVRSMYAYSNYTPPVPFTVQARSSDKSPFPPGLLTVVYVGVVGGVAADRVDINPYYREGFAPTEMFSPEYIFWRDDLKVYLDRPLGHGFFGTVYEGELVMREAGEARAEWQKVAVKTQGEAANTEDIRQFLREAAVMQ
ncbi:hypothetical protein Pcinc_014604 [Petrolisthes cinctipes]|uniref:Serine-threonine/tyrosine-protein kinase catalytic domain-containing protein n=1 Tax=Petrolisthes cinctipes TaxID=88211 RepID=A0AAE1FW47_PETCI|nr:hypothetical protein Pcinc_014604 [Petrolisthes cinctipes]